MEELVAEIGAAFLCADLRITPETREDHAAYIGSWLKVLRDDKRAIFTAASHAQRAADHLHGYQALERHNTVTAATPVMASASTPTLPVAKYSLPDPAHRAQFQKKDLDHGIDR